MSDVRESPVQMSPASAAPALEVRNLGKCFPARDRNSDPLWVIRDMSFDVREGEFLTIVGPSGSGKTTLLNMIAQTDIVSEGEIFFRGERIMQAGKPALQPGWSCQIGYVTQEDNLLPWRSALDNILFPLRSQNRLDDEGLDRAPAR